MCKIIVGKLNNAIKYQLSDYTKGITLSCIVGFLLSVYALYVELNVESDTNYEALCDISEHISCTKVFSSNYGRGFGIIGEIFGEHSILNQPNSLAGIFFYILIALLGYINNKTASKVQLILATISNAMSIYLAYLLYFILNDFCIVCVSTYIVNFINLFLSFKRYQLIIKYNQNEKTQKND